MVVTVVVEGSGGLSGTCKVRYIHNNTSVFSDSEQKKRRQEKTRERGKNKFSCDFFAASGERERERATSSNYKNESSAEGSTALPCPDYLFGIINVMEGNGMSIKSLLIPIRGLRHRSTQGKTHESGTSVVAKLCEFIIFLLIVHSNCNIYVLDL